MAADGSVIIEIEGNASEVISEFQRVASAADNIESSVQQIANAFRDATNAAEDLDGAGLDDVANSAEDLDQGLTEASRAANRLEDSLDGDISGELDEAANAADNLDDALDDAAQAADRLDNSTNSAGGGLGRLRDGFTTLKATAAGVLSDLATRAIDAFVGLGKEALTAADALTKFGSTMEFAGFDSATIESSKAAVQDYAARTVYELETVANTTAQLAANGVADFVGLTEAAGNLNAVAGGNAETFKSVAMALTQTVGAGKLTTENWNQIADAIPGASGKLQEAMRQNGAFVGDFREAMAEGQITAEEFQQAIMDLGMTDAAIEAASSVATIEGAVGNLKATIVDGITGLLTDSGGMEAITGFINGITSVLESAGQYIDPAIETIRSSIASVGEHFRETFSPEQQAAISGFLQNLAGFLVSVPFQLVASAAMVLGEAFQFLIDVGAVLGAVVQFLEDAIYAIFDPALTVKDAFTDLGNTVSSVFGTAQSDAEEASGGITNSMTAMARGVETSAREAADAASGEMARIPEETQQNLDQAVVIVDEWGNNLVSSASGSVAETVSTVKTGLEAIPDDTSASLDDTIDGVSEWGTEMTETATSAAEETAEGIKTSLETAVPEARTVGQNIADGLAEGIRAGKSGVISAATEIASAALQAAKTKLDLHSPSKEFETLGLFTSEGFAEGIRGGMKYVDDAVDELTADTKEHVNDLNAEIERIEEEAARRQAEKELAAHEKSLADLYKELEEAELDKRDAINEKIAKLEADWAEKQLKAQENAQKEALESQIKALEATEAAYEEVYASMQDALEEFSDEYQSALDEVAQDRDSLAGELSDFSLFDLYEGEMHVWSIQPMIDQINAYGEAITGLQDRGVNQSLLNEILELDRQEATQFANELLAMSDEQYTQYMALWQEKEDAAAQVAASIYQGEMDAIETEYAEKLPEMMAETADEAMLTLAEHLESTGETAVLTAANIADRIIAEIERINAAQRLTAAVSGASASYSSSLAGNVQNASDGASAARSAQATETAGALSMVNTVSASREIVLNINGKEMARTFVPDLRAVEDQSPQIVSDTR